MQKEAINGSRIFLPLRGGGGKSSVIKEEIDFFLDGEISPNTGPKNQFSPKNEHLPPLMCILCMYCTRKVCFSSLKFTSKY